MARPDYKTCKACGGHASDVGVISHERLCERCGDARRYSNWQAMLNHRGDEWTKWRRSMAASVGGVLIDDLQSDA